MKKYEFTDETKIIDGAVLHRIRAVRPIPEMGVRAGTLGGFLQAERNLPHDCPAWVGGGACVLGSALVEDRAFVSGQTTVKGGAVIGGSAVVVGLDVEVTGAAYVGGLARIREYAQIYGSISVEGSVAISGHAKVHGAGSIQGNERIGFDADVGSNRDWLHIGPAKSSGRYVTAYKDAVIGVRVQTGCFTGTVEEFSRAIEGTHQRNQETPAPVPPDLPADRLQFWSAGMTWAPTWNQYPKRAPDVRWADNWEDDPAREHRVIYGYRRKEPNQQRKLHLGLVGPGAFLKKIIENERRQAASKRD